jgi:secreted PhoX family phosphatase
MAGSPNVHDNKYGGSRNVNAGNMFNSPDGMLWIQTDSDDSNEGEFEGQGSTRCWLETPKAAKSRAW